MSFKNLLVLLFLGLAACESAPNTEAKPEEEAAEVAPEPVVEKAPSSWEGTDGDTMLKRLDASITHHAKQAEAQKDSWLDLQKVAQSHMGRARLTGSYEEYALAEEVLKDAVARAPEGSGPDMALVSLNFALHRFAKIEPILQKIEKRPMLNAEDRAAVLSTRGDLKLSEGELDQAQALYNTALEVAPSAANMVRMAHLERYRGNLAESQSWFEKAVDASKRDSKFERAWTILQFGILELERGNYDAAMGHFQAANEMFSGWYLILEHIAEIHSIKGELKEAEELYLDVLARVPSPEFMDALADVLEEKGDKAGSTQWREKASAGYKKQLERFPEAAYGHALDHFIGTDPAFALELAQKNHEVRPGPEAATSYALASMAAGKHDQALELIKGVENTAWSTADYHAIAYWIKSHHQDPSAETHKTRAAELHPDVIDDYAWLKPLKN